MPRLFLDVDGVFADFVGGACRVHSREVSTVDCWDFHRDRWGISDTEFWQPIVHEGAKFWERLDLLPWAESLLEYVRSIEHNFSCISWLTAKPGWQGAEAAKMSWIRRLDKNYPILFSSNKAEHCKAIDDILVDDCEANVKAWREAGGFAILFPAPWNANDYITDKVAYIRGSMIQLVTNCKKEFAVIDTGNKKEFESGMVRNSAEGKVEFDRVFDGPLFERWATHLTRGAAVYPDLPDGRPNWTLANGQAELNRFRRSAVRHFVQAIRGDTDEDHFAAVCFNMNGMLYVQQRMAENN